MKAADLEAQGYLLSDYNVAQMTRTFRYRGETYTLPDGLVRLHDIPGYPYKVARIEDVLRAQNEMWPAA
jgi:hypothetical protein